MIVHSESTVHVETSGNGSSDVHIQSTTKSSNTTTTTTNGKTDIVIECNGVKKEYHSNNAENVNINCDDGTKGTITNVVKISNTAASPTVDPTITQEKKGTKDEENNLKKEVKGAKGEVREQRQDLFEKITQMIRNFFKNFHF